MELEDRERCGIQVFSRGAGLDVGLGVVQKDCRFVALELRLIAACCGLEVAGNEGLLRFKWNFEGKNFCRRHPALCVPARIKTEHLGRSRYAGAWRS
jgi:hypothetical protein